MEEENNPDELDNQQENDETSLSLKQEPDTSDEEFDTDLESEEIKQENEELVENERNDAITKRKRCGICDKTFRSLYELKIHARIHNGETPYQCSSCNKAF